jgi:hypothetical protein
MQVVDYQDSILSDFRLLGIAQGMGFFSILPKGPLIYP